MGKGNELDRNVKKQIEEELNNITIIHDYLSKTGQKDEKFSAIREKNEIILLDSGVRVPNILLLENLKGVTEIMHKYSTEYGKDEIDELSKKTGLNRNDICELLKDGMKINEIESAVKRLPFTDIAESAAIREMIRRDIDLPELQKMKDVGLSVLEHEDGSIRITGLEKIAQVDSNGMMIFEDNWLEKNLMEFEQVGLINVSQELVVKEMNDDEIERIGIDSLTVVPLKEREKEKTEEDKKKIEIAEVLGEKPENIISVISIEDRDGGSKLFNHNLKNTDKPMIVRLRNNNFKLMQEDKNGKKSELQGYEATPVSKEVASLLHDTAASSLHTSIKAGEVRAGKTNPNQERYNIFQIRRAGESLDDGANQLLYVGFSGNTDMNVIENGEDGNFVFDKVPTKTIYPSSIYLEGHAGLSSNRKLVSKDEEEIENVVEFADIENLKDLLEKFEEIQREINEIEAELSMPDTLESQSKDDTEQYSTDDVDISEALADKKRKLPVLYERRNEILSKLGFSEAHVKEVEEYAHEHTIGPKNYN